MFGLGFGKSAFSMDQLAIFAAVAFVVFILSRGGKPRESSKSHWIKQLNDEADVRAIAIITERYGRKKANDFVDALIESPQTTSTPSQSPIASAAGPVKLKPIGEAVVS